MVRKVGFDDKKEKSVAEAHLDKFREQTRKQAQTQKPVRRVQRQWFLIFFLLFWLTGWTGGMVFAFLTALKGGEFFLWIWLFFAAMGWIAAAISLIKSLKGTPVND